MLFVLALVAIDPDITRQQIANIIGVSLSTIEKSINNLRKEKILSREGADKTGYWKIIKRN